MIVFINGSFGVGKTTVAELLVERIANSLLFDAEEVGFMLRKIIEPIEWSGDFQNYPMWRSLLIETAKGLRANYNRNLIMPMTIWRADYFTEVLTGLAAFEPELYHFCLTAPGEIMDRYKIKIDATSKSPTEIAQLILQILTTQPDNPLSY